jgi:hypothetical protein
MQHEVQGLRGKCPKMEATEGKDNEHDVLLKVFQWSEAWSVQGTRTSKHQDDVLKKKNFRVLTMYEAVKYKSSGNCKYTSHIIISRQVSVGVYV